jgi:tetratricopeptide (TPR) repeat protein
VALPNHGNDPQDAAEAVVALNSEEPYTRHTRGWIQLAKGSVDLALADFDKALSLDAEIAGWHADRGRAYELKGERERAIADYRKALSLKSQQSQSYDDEAKAVAKQHLIALRVMASIDGEPEAAAQPEPQAPANPAKH